MKQKPAKHPLFQQAHTKLAIVILAVAAVISISLLLYATSPAVRQSGYVTTTPTSVPTDTPTPFKGPKVTYHVNNTAQWATYASPDIPISIQFPPQWKYYDSSDVESGAGKPNIYITGTQKTGSALDVIFSPASTQDGTYTDGIYISWAGSFGDPQDCIARPSIQLKNEALTACEYKDGEGNDRMQIDKRNLYLFIRTSASGAAAKQQILNILSTLLFTK